MIAVVRGVIVSVGVFLLSARAVSADTSEPVFEERFIIDLLHKVNQFQQNHPWRETDRNWIRGTYYTGLMNFYRATGDARLLEQAMAWGRKHRWAVGTERPGGNKLTCVQTWAELFLLKRDPAMIQPAIEWLHSGNPATPTGAKVWYKDGDLRYADSLYVGPPALALLAEATGDAKYLQWMHAFYWDVHDKLYSSEHDLYFRDRRFIDQHSPNGKRIFWARGNGWVFAGLPRILDHLPKNDPYRPRYVEVFQRMAKAIVAAQQPDGLWRSNLADPMHYRMPESSSSAFFVTGLAWGVRQGVLDKQRYLPAVMRGWAGLVRCVNEEGRLGWVQPVDGEPRPSAPVTTHEYAMGMLLSAGSEVLRLVRAGMIPEHDAIEDAAKLDNILPAHRLRPGPVPREAHPLADTINRVIQQSRSAADFKPTGLTKRDYLEVIAGQVKAMHRYQNAAGRIIDPVDKMEKYYATPCYAHAVAALVAANYPIDAELRESGRKALDVALADMVSNKAAGGHGDFYTWPAVLAFELFKGHAEGERYPRWRRQLAAIEPSKLYRYYQPPVGLYDGRGLYKAYDAYHHNWGVVNAAGESARAALGLTDPDYFEYVLTLQLKNFTPMGMYNEHGNPLPYDLFPRHYLSGMLHRGYRGLLFEPYRDILWRGAWMSLLMQSPFGELPTGYRSSHHGWNEAEQAVVFEVYARHHAAAGRMQEAGMFKRAARLSLACYQRWLREDGTGFVVKNRYPIEAKHGYETYTAHTCYNLLACSMLAQAWQFADDNIAERPCPAEVGGFALHVPEFHKVFANAAGNYVEYDTQGDMSYNPTGLLRVHLCGGHPQLGPSDGCAEKFSGKGALVATGPVFRTADGQLHALAAQKAAPTVEVLGEGPEQVRFRVTYRPEQATITETFTIDDRGVTVRDAVSGDQVTGLRVTWPMLVFDGQNETQVEEQGNGMRLTLDGRSVTFRVLEPAGVTVKRTGRRLKHRNGVMEIAVAEVPGQEAVYRLTAE